MSTTIYCNVYRMEFSVKKLLLLLLLLLAESQKAYTRKTVTGILLYCTRRMTRVVIKRRCAYNHDNKK